MTRAERQARIGALTISDRASAGIYEDKSGPAIRQVLEGKLYLSEQLQALFAEKFVGGDVATAKVPVDLLSDRELEVFQLLGQGYETRQIAGALNISMKTVQAFCARIKEKLKLASATELLREAVRWHENQQAG